VSFFLASVDLFISGDFPVLKDGGYPQYGDRQKATPGRETVCHGALMAC